MKIALAFVAVIVALLLGAALALQAGLLRAPVENYLSRKLQRPVAMAALRANVLSLNPSLHVKELKIDNAPWAGTAPLADIQQLDVYTRWGSLLRGKPVISKLEMQQGSVNLLRQASGRANWAGNEAKSGPLTLPAIRRFYLTQSHLNLVDEGKKLSLQATLNSQENNADSKQPFQVVGEGKLNNQPFKLNLTGGALLAADLNKPYPFTLELTHGATHVQAKGTFAQPFNSDNFAAGTVITGANLADLYYLTGLAFPITHAYKLEGVLGHEGSTFFFHKFAGKVGASDLSGDIDVDTSGDKPYLTAKLFSKLLDPRDAGVIFGQPDTTRVLPDVPLAVDRLRAMDADVKYKADAINVSTLPLKEVDLTLKLKDAQLAIKPLTLTLPQGTLTGSLDIDAKAEVPDVIIDVKLSGARLEDFMSKSGQPNALEGPLLARAKLHGSGTSVHKAAGNADGVVTVVVPGGQIRQAFAELLGINVSRGLGLLMSSDQQQTPLRCAVAHFEADKGMLVGRHVVFDTGVVLARGRGTVNLDTEALDLTLKGESKEPRLLHLMAPITVTGTLRNPRLGVRASGATAQAGIATVLGVALTPIAAILPFVDAGAAENANCTALLERAQDHGVPLKNVQIASPTH
ncbi:MAG TPA: AsmA family protein [Alphaproteobacteria bacterium]|nr:AsmA family protein [Alphaproteobacteria bacterium]